jgi:hypothetical protein
MTSTASIPPHRGSLRAPAQELLTVAVATAVA